MVLRRSRSSGATLKKPRTTSCNAGSSTSSSLPVLLLEALLLFLLAAPAAVGEGGISDECLADTAALFDSGSNATADLRGALAAWESALAEKFDASCNAANRSASRCAIISSDDLSAAHGDLVAACDDAGGIVYLFSGTFDCRIRTRQASGRTVVETFDVPECYASTCAGGGNNSSTDVLDDGNKNEAAAYDMHLQDAERMFEEALAPDGFDCVALESLRSGDSSGSGHPTHAGLTAGFAGTGVWGVALAAWFGF